MCSVVAGSRPDWWLGNVRTIFVGETVAQKDREEKLKITSMTKTNFSMVALRDAEIVHSDSLQDVIDVLTNQSTVL